MRHRDTYRDRRQINSKINTERDIEGEREKGSKRQGQRKIYGNRETKPQGEIQRRVEKKRQTKHCSLSESEKVTVREKTVREYLRKCLTEGNMESHSERQLVRVRA